MSSSQLFAKEKIAYFFQKVNGFAGKESGRRAKSSVENGPAVVHNAEATGKTFTVQNSTPYVNKCNYLTQDIGRNRRTATNILCCGWHKIRNKNRSKVDENRKNKWNTWLFEIIWYNKPMKNTTRYKLLPFDTWQRNRVFKSQCRGGLGDVSEETQGDQQ